MNEPKDGFDLIEYPCDYNFKAMCRADPDQTAEDYVREVVEAKLGTNSLLDVSSKASKTGKFEAVTFVIKLENRQQLESIYQFIAHSERVVMTL